MVVHKQTAKAIKKRVRKHAKKVIAKAQREDVLPSLKELNKMLSPRMLVAPGIGTVLARNPLGLIALATYHAIEQSEKYWGEPLYGRFLPPDTSTAIDPSTPWEIPEGYGYTPKMGRKKPVSTKRKVSKANKATSRAYAYLIKHHKGKMSRKKCQELLKKAARMASRANPNTKSRIGKRSSKMLKECMKIRKAIWKRSKRY